MKFTKTKSYKTFKEAIWSNNPISKQILGICSALAVTVQLKPALTMSAALISVLALSNFIVSLMRNLIPRNIRIIVELAVVATLVILADQLLKAFLFDLSKQLSVYVGLIITNCIVLGRAETFALGNPPIESFFDGLGNGCGYAMILIAVAFVRELLGAGKIFGFTIIPDAFYSAGYVNMGIMSLAPGAFIAIGLLVWLQHSLSK